MERRLTTIVAADMVGYSRLMEADEIGTIERQRAHRKEVLEPNFKKFNGRLIKTTGDGLLAEFPSVVEAVQCMVNIQQAMSEREGEVEEDRRIQYRIGINLGDVVFDEDDVYGDGVNIAARLEQMCDPGGICISGTTYDHLKAQVEVGYESLGEVQVKNIERPVRAYKVLVEFDQVGELIEKAGQRLSKTVQRAIVVMSIVLLAGIIGGGWWWAQQPDFEPADTQKFAFEVPEKPSIIVLPFDNLSGDVSQDYLGDSLTENIIAELATIPNLLVIARNSAFTYKGKPTKVQQVAEEMGVEFVLEGSVQTDGDKMRVVAQLVDAVDGKHLWSERYDYEIADIFAVQDDITTKLTEAMDVKLTTGEQAREWRKDFKTPSAYRKYIEGRTGFGELSLAGHKIAFKNFTELHKEYPENPAVLRLMSWLHTHKSQYGFDQSVSPAEHWKLARQFAHRMGEALGDDKTGDFHALMAWLHLWERDFDTAIKHADKAVELSPASADVYGVGGLVKTSGGMPRQGVDWLHTSIRLEPISPPWREVTITWALLQLERYDEVIATASEVLPHTTGQARRGALSALLVANTILGKVQAARSNLDQLFESFPDISVQTLKQTLVVKDQGFYQRVLDAYRQAGVPENPPPKLPDKPSIAVLPFDNMSNEAEQEFFVDGMTEDLITRLANISGLFVIARNTMFTYKGKSVDVKKVGRDLGIQYVLEGSVRRSGNKVRINAQLIDAVNGGHLWAEIYDRELADVFQLQDEVTSAIVKALSVTLTPSEAKRVAQASTTNMKAYDLFLKARELHHGFRPFDRSLNRALELYRAAYSEDPRFADAYASDASLSLLVWRLQWSKVLPTQAARARTLESLEKALSIDPDHALALSTKASLLSANGQHDRAISLATKAVSLAPGDHRTRQNLAYMLAVSGNTEDAVVEMDLSVRVNPNPNPEDSWVAAYTYFHVREYAKSIVFAERTIDQISGSQIGYYPLVASNARLGQKIEAKAALDTLLEIVPFENWQLNLQSTNYMAREVQIHFVDSMKSAGLPEWPYGFEGEADNLVPPDEERRLLWGKQWIGLWKPFGEARFSLAEDGSWKASFPQAGFVATGSTVEQDGHYCTTMDGSINRPPSCRLIYRNPNGTADKQNEYILVDIYGIYEFSAFD